MSEATYLYCLVRAPEKPSLAGAPPGLPGLSPPRALAAGDGLWLIAADAPLSRNTAATRSSAGSPTSPGSPTAPSPMRR